VTRSRGLSVRADRPARQRVCHAVPPLGVGGRLLSAELPRFGCPTPERSSRWGTLAGRAAADPPGGGTGDGAVPRRAGPPRPAWPARADGCGRGLTMRPVRTPSTRRASITGWRSTLNHVGRPQPSRRRRTHDDHDTHRGRVTERRVTRGASRAACSARRPRGRADLTALPRGARSRPAATCGARCAARRTASTRIARIAARSGVWRDALYGRSRSRCAARRCSDVARWLAERPRFLRKSARR